MVRHTLFAGAILLSATAAFAQGQQRQDDLGIMSMPQQGSSSSMNAPVQQVAPLQTAPVQSPTITNNPDYPRQPIFVPSPFYSPFPGQFQGQFPGPTPGQTQPAQARTQQPGQTPGQAPSEQRGRGAFTAPG